MDLESNCFHCTMCFYYTASFKDFCSHMVRFHKHDAHFIVNCGFGACSFVTKSWSAFKMHVKRSHQTRNMAVHVTEPLNDSSGDDYMLGENNDDMSNLDVRELKQLMLSAAYLLSLEAEHKLSQRAIDGVISTTSQLLEQQISCVQNQLEVNMKDAGVTPESDIFHNVMSTGFFTDLETVYKRKKFYVQHFNLVEPREAFLGTTVVKHRSRVFSQKKYGFVVPFEKSLRALLSMPDVWHYVQSPHTSRNDVMGDVCDGYYMTEHPLFGQKKHALQIILYTDDIEIVNPIGAHVKKHKLTVFYFTLANIPPQYRSKLTAIQLLAIAKTKDVRKFGAKMLLGDFLQSVTKMAENGIEMHLHGANHVITGTLLLVVADTPAAHWLGGFKEGVGFSYKSCRACNASAITMKTHFVAESFQERLLDEHLKRCTDLASLSKDARKYWSRQWGVNDRSCLCSIPHFDICASLVQDPMHVLLEGVVGYELRLFLYFCIFDCKYFTVDWLNMQLMSFQYTYLETDKPEPFMKGDIMFAGKIKQTSAAMLTLCKVLPFIISLKVPSTCEHWLNFLRLVQITFLATAPYVTADTAGQLKQLVAVHHIFFREHYPRANLSPKMHYLVHLPNQLLRFGPLRHHWCLRFEAKHAFFKSLNLKCFKNIPKSLAYKHQLWMCHKMLGPMGTASCNFLYDGDVVSEGTGKAFHDVYADLFPSLMALTDCEPEAVVYFTNAVQIHGVLYKPGCAIFTGYSDTGLPSFAVLRDICVYDDVKFFVLEALEIEYFETSMLSYVVTDSGSFNLVRYGDLQNPWPLSLHTVGGRVYVMNTYAYVTEFIA